MCADMGLIFLEAKWARDRISRVPPQGEAIEPGRAAAAAVVSSRPVNGDGFPKRRF